MSLAGNLPLNVYRQRISKPFITSSYLTNDSGWLFCHMASWSSVCSRSFIAKENLSLGLQSLGEDTNSFVVHTLVGTHDSEENLKTKNWNLVTYFAFAFRKLPHLLLVTNTAGFHWSCYMYWLHSRVYWEASFSCMLRGSASFLCVLRTRGFIPVCTVRLHSPRVLKCFIPVACDFNKWPDFMHTKSLHYRYCTIFEQHKTN